MVDYASFSVSVWSFAFKKLNWNYECQAKTEGWLLFFGNTENQTTWANTVFSSLKKIHDWFQSSGWASKHWQFLRICTDQLHFISFLPPILILVFPQSATFQVYIVWRARDGQVGEGTIELAHPLQVGPHCIRTNILKNILEPLLFLPF